MATYDSATGLGGLDGSIGFETDRPENVGSAFNTTVSFFAPLQTKRTSCEYREIQSTILRLKG